MSALSGMWTRFVLEAEYESFGLERICIQHNKILKENENLRQLVKALERELAKEKDCKVPNRA